jgi:hypothetical protein
LIDANSAFFIYAQVHKLDAKDERRQKQPESRLESIAAKQPICEGARAGTTSGK